MPDDKKVNEWFLKGTAVMMLMSDLHDHTQKFQEFKDAIANMRPVQIERIYEAPKEGTITKDDIIQHQIDDFADGMSDAKDENDRAKEADEQREKERKAKADEIMKQFKENKKDITRSR